MRVLALQPFDELGQLWWDNARLPAIAARFRSQGGKATAAIAQCPIQQGVDRKRSALRIRDLVLARSDLLRPAREFAARQDLQNQRSNQRIAAQSNFVSPSIHHDQPSTL